MADILNIGISALLANQRMLSTAGHNISNANTPGYSRQTVQLTARPPQTASVGFLGKGVQVAAISRSADEFLTTQVRATTSAESRASIFAQLSGQVDQLLGSGNFTATLSRFFNAEEDMNNDPSSSSARTVFLNTAQSLVDRFKDADTSLAALASGVNDQIATKVGRINSLSGAIATLNKEIVQAIGVAQGAKPNDLLDQRDNLLKELSKLVNVSTLEQQDGAVNVFIGNGQLLVAGPNKVDLAVTPNSLDGSRNEISLTTGASSTVITGAVTSGELAGVLQFRDGILDPARNAMGRLAVGLSQTFNAQHQQGMDLNGALGGNVFGVGGAVVTANPANAGSIAVTLDPNNLASLTTSDYRLQFNGTNYLLTRADDGTQQILSGAGPFNVDGMSIAVAGVPANGDVYSIQPTKYAIRNLSVLISDPSKIALASPIQTNVALTNIGDATVSPGQVLAVTNPALLTATQIVFNNPPTTFQINGAGPLIPYTSGGNIDANGWRVQIDGNPQAGDVFRISANANGRGDNTNGLALAGLATTKFLNAGTSTYQDAFSQLVGSIGARTEQAKISGNALTVQRENAEAARDSLAGVNTDEEAANLIRFQQAYQGAAQMIKIANDTFQTLLDAVSR